MTDEEAVCDLAEGNLLDWKGLQPFDVEVPPACLGRQESDGWLQFRWGYAAYRVFRCRSEGPEVWLFTLDDSKVRLIEVFLLPTSLVIGVLREQLGAPELKVACPLPARLQRPLGTPDEDLNELVYARKGLALLLGRNPEARERLIRVRGFEIMSAEAYRHRFVDLPPVRFI